MTGPGPRGAGNGGGRPARRRRPLGLLALLALLAGVALAPRLDSTDPLAQRLSDALQPPSWQHPLGTDPYGRDELARVLAGTQRSVLAALVVVVIGFSVGILMGTLTAAAPRPLRRLLTGVVDVGLGVPSVVVGIVIIGVLGPGIRNTVVALSLLGWCWYARLAQEHAADLLAGRVVAAARVAGVPIWRNLLGHVVPHVGRRLTVVACQDIGYVILVIAGLSYLGLGDQEPKPELGQMLNIAQDYVLDAPWLVLGPVLAIVLVVLPFMVVGERVHARVLRS